MSRSKSGTSVKSKVKTTIEFKEECSFCTGPCKTKESPFNKRFRPLEKTTHTASYETKNCFITFTEVEERVIRSSSDVTKAVTRGEDKKSKHQHKRHARRRKLSAIDVEMENYISLKNMEKLEEYRIKKKLGLIPDKVGKYEKLLREVGPHWYQELSYNQMAYASMLGPTLIMDMEEYNLSRMHKLMDGLGISPPPTNAQLLQAARLSYLNPILFLIYLFKFTSEENSLLRREFSVNDRIILSTLAYIALPRTMVDLESRLPKDFFMKPPFVAKRMHKPLPKVVTSTYYKNKKEKPTSPYLQTLPYFVLRCRQDEAAFREEEKFLNKLAFRSRSTSKAVLNEIISYDNLSITAKKNKDETEDSLTLVKDQNDPKHKKHRPPRRNSKIEGKTSSQMTVHFAEIASPKPSPTKLPSEPPAPKPKGRVQINLGDDYDDDDEEELMMEPPDLAAFEKLLPDETKAEDEKPETQEVLVGDVEIIVGNIDELKPEVLKKLEELDKDIVKDSDKDFEKIIEKEEKEVVIVEEKDFESVESEVPIPNPNSDKVYNRIVNSYYTPIDSVLDSLDAAFRLAMEDLVPDEKPVPPPSPPPEEEEQNVEEAELVLKDGAELPAPLPTKPSIVAVLFGYWTGHGMDMEGDSIDESFSVMSSASSNTKFMSKSRTVKKILARMGRQGNILAGMPDIDRLPAIVEWLKYTEVPILSAKKKEELMMMSKGQWEVHQIYPEQVQVPYPRFQSNHLDWSQKNWFKRQVDQLYDKYRRDVRRAQVNDARKYWATMCMNDFRSPPTFREVYFTYLQAREEDTAQKKLFFL